MHNRARILYLSNSYPDTVSGVTTVVRNLVEVMSKKYEIAVVCPNTTPRYVRRVVRGIPHYFLPSYPTLIRQDVRFITPNPFQFQKVFDDFRPDLIHFHDPSPASMVLKEIAVRNGIPVIFSHHFTPQMVLGYLPETLKTIAQKKDNLNKAILQLTCRLYENSSGIIVPTVTVKKTLKPLTSLPVSVISSGIDRQALADCSESKIIEVAHTYNLPKSPFIFYAGRLDPEKNIHILLQAWAKIAGSLPGHTLVIVGDGGKTEKLHDLADNLNLGKSIVWTGHISHSDLPAVYRNPLAKIFVIPSPIESQSIVTLMALAAGLPVVAAAAGALPEIVIDGQTGYLCPVDKPSIFAKYIKFLCDNPRAALEMGSRGRKLAVKHDMTHVMNKYHLLYEKLLNK